MNPSDEELLHAFYAGDNDAIEALMERHDALLRQVAFLILQTRTGSAVQALREWDGSADFGPLADAVKELGPQLGVVVMLLV